MQSGVGSELWHVACSAINWRGQHKSPLVLACFVASSIILPQIDYYNLLTGEREKREAGERETKREAIWRQLHLRAAFNNGLFRRIAEKGGSKLKEQFEIIEQEFCKEIFYLLFLVQKLKFYYKYCFFSI